MDIVNNVIWIIATICLVGSGLYYTFKLNFIQFDFKNMLKSLKNDRKSKEAISPFQTLTLALAARIGVGSLAGIALGILNGGVGVVFWIWLSALLTIPNAFVESTLAVKYREKDGKFYKGGPAYYIKSGLGFKKMAIIYAIVLCFCYLGGFLAIQSNTITSSIHTYFPSIPNYFVGLIICFISYFIIVKGLKGIANFTSKLVPIMGLLYMILAFIIIISNINLMPSVFKTIIVNAFNFKTFGWGIISSVIIVGVQRGIFSSESGIGTGAIASGTSDTDSPCKQGYLQMLGVYFTTFIVCTSTAFIIITSSVLDNVQFIDPNGIEITQKALEIHLGSFGNIVLVLAIIAFAFSTVISGYYYGESNVKYLFKDISNKGIMFVKLFVIGVLFYGSIAKPSSLWDLVDIGVAVLAIVNIIAIILLRKDSLKEYSKYKGIK